MAKKLDRRRFIKLTGAAGMAAIAGCSGSDGETTPTSQTTVPPTEEPTEEPTTTEEVPDPTATDSALIEPVTLKEWQDAELVNTDQTAADRVVILRIDTDGYDAGHVPGAIKWSTENGEGPAVLTQTRLAGLAETDVLVPEGSIVDEVIQSAGVGQNTTIVLSGKMPMRIARAYWTLRYWGFPRERVKVLNGGTTKYGDEYDLEFDTPDHPTSSYTVKAFGEPNWELRTGLNEMIRKVDDKNAGEIDDAFLDLRGDTTPRPTGATADPPASYLQGDSFTGDFPWQDAETVSDHVWGLDGVSEGDNIVVFCGSAYRASMAFFAIDGIMGYDDVTVWDGSVSKQWVHYDANNDPVPNDAWRVDIEDRTEGDTGESALEIDPDLNDQLTALDTIEANQVKKADIEYMGADTSGGGFGCGE